MHIEGNVTKIDEVSAVERKFSVELPWNEVEKQLSKAYRDLQKHVNIRGFRPGKVPRPMLEKQYGEAVKADVAKELAGHFLEHHFEENDVKAVSAPVIEEYKYSDGEKLSFTAKVEVRPEISLEQYRGIEITARPVSVMDEEVQAELEAVRESHAQIHPVTGRDVAEKGDVVFFELAELKDGQEARKQNLSGLIGEGRLHPVLESRLAGVKTGEPFELDLPARPNAPEGETKRFRVRVNEIKAKVLPELNDDFARDLGEYSDLGALKDFVKGRLVKGREEQARMDSEEELVREIIAKNPFPVPESLVERQLNAYIENFKQMMGGRSINEEAARSEFSPRALFGVQRALILDAVAKREGIAVDDDDMELELKRIAERMKKNVMWVRAQYEKDNQMDELRYNLRERKVLDYLMREAKVVEKKAGTEAEAAKE
jgi:trigger factor